MESWLTSFTAREALMEHGEPPGEGVSRRTFLGMGSLLSGAVLAGCAADAPAEPYQHAESTGPVPTPGVYRFFTPEEVPVVEAIAGRIIPGDDEDPGAREAGVVTYIDAKLAAFEGFAEPTFLRGPTVQTVSGGEAAAGEGPVVPEDQAYRYGYQSGTMPQELYRNGLQALDRYSQARFDTGFVDLSEEDQDAVLEVLDRIQQRSEQSGQSRQGGSATGGDEGGGQESGSANQEAEAAAAERAFGELDPGAFFTTVREDTIEGMFADPSHGGNRDMVGWALVGYPGPQRAYSPGEMLFGTDRRRQSHADLPVMNPDRPGGAPRGALEQPRRGVREG
jgi:gluconate 2-dehydrogenase gamma chain